MSLSGTLDVAIGVAVVLFFVSLAASACAELLEGLLRYRSKNLERGIVQLAGKALTGQIFAHPLVRALYQGETKKPSYIPANIFALALVSELAKKAPSEASPASVRTLVTVEGLPPAMRTALGTLAEQAENRLEPFVALVEGWYNATMDRVSGWYKRHAQLVLLLVGLALALALNIDVISVGQLVARNSALRANLVAASRTLPPPPPVGASPNVVSDVDQLASLSLPLGWTPIDEKDPRNLPTSPAGWLIKVFGFLLTALGVSLGAPFWFDVLNRLSVVRSTVKPGEKAGPDATKA